MSTVPAVSAVASAVAFSLSADQNETISAAAEMSVDADFDSLKAIQMIGGIFKSFNDVVVARDEKTGEVTETMLTHEVWEVVRVKFVTVGEVRARDNGALNPSGAAGDVWYRITKALADFPYNLKKPKKKGGDAERVRVKREQEEAKALEVAAGRSAAELTEAQMALFGQMTAESIAQAKALDAVIKLVAKQEKDSVDAQIKPLVSAARDSFKRAIEYLIAQNDQNRLADLVVMLGDFEPPKQ